MGSLPCNQMMGAIENPALIGRKATPRFLTNPMKHPQQIQLQAILLNGSGITQIFLEDAIQLGVILGLVGGANSQTMTVPVVTATVLRRYLLSYAMVVSGYDFECNNASELAKNLQFFESSIDQNSSSETIFSSVARNNYQNNPNLLNIAQPFVLTPNTNIKMTTTAPLADTTYTFTLYIEAVVPHADLDAYLASRSAK